MGGDERHDMTRRILVPIDGSDHSWKAVEYALETFDGEEIHVLHVVDPAESVYTGVEGGYSDQRSFEVARAAGEELCEEARDHAENTGALETTVLETAVEVGRPTREILGYAADQEVDHIVMGSHGRSGVSRVLLGSVAETVMRRAAVPVTILR